MRKAYSQVGWTGQVCGASAPAQQLCGSISSRPINCDANVKCGKPLAAAAAAVAVAACGSCRGLLNLPPATADEQLEVGEVETHKLWQGCAGCVASILVVVGRLWLRKSQQHLLTWLKLWLRLDALVLANVVVVFAFWHFYDIR